MPTDRPTADELLDAVAAFLTDKAAPNLDGQLAFHARVAANVIAIVRRELAQAGAMNEAERRRLTALLARDGDLDALNRTLAKQIRAGALRDKNDAVLAHLRQTAVDKLRLANPRHLGPSDAAA